jgi:hypothetical protein
MSASTAACLRIRLRRQRVRGRLPAGPHVLQPFRQQCQQREHHQCTTRPSSTTSRLTGSVQRRQRDPPLPRGTPGAAHRARAAATTWLARRDTASLEPKQGRPRSLQRQTCRVSGAGVSRPGATLSVVHPNQRKRNQPQRAILGAAQSGAGTIRRACNSRTREPRAHRALAVNCLAEAPPVERRGAEPPPPPAPPPPHAAARHRPRFSSCCPAAAGHRHRIRNGQRRRT